jgi:hypothetical protein
VWPRLNRVLAASHSGSRDPAKRSMGRHYCPKLPQRAGDPLGPTIQALLIARPRLSQEPAAKDIVRDEISEIECLCAPWMSPRASQPEPPSQSRAKIEIWREDMGRLWGAQKVQVRTFRPLAPRPRLVTP